MVTPPFVIKIKTLPQAEERQAQALRYGFTYLWIGRIDTPYFANFGAFQ